MSKRNRSTWQQCLEDIMYKYIDLCVEMRKGKVAKDGLQLYRQICVQNPGSLETIINYFLRKSEEEAERAHSQSDAVVISQLEDLDEYGESAESLLLSYVSGEDSRDRTDRELVTPWLKVL